MMQLVLKILSSRFTVVRLDASAALPPWALAGEFCSITRTANELSIVCESVQVPDRLCSETDWRALEVQGPLQFDQVGIMAALAQVLADRSISIFAVSTYDTDYLLLKNTKLKVAVEALEQAGHQVIV